MTALENLISRRIIESGGWISFADFMSLSLNEPGLGYYSSDKKIFGNSPDDGSDFITGSEATSLFARLLARPIAQVLGKINIPHVLEFGAGTGKFAINLLEELVHLGYSSVRYTIVDLSKHLMKRQFETVKKYAPHQLPNINWVDSLPVSFEGVVVANEVLDALPVQLIVNREGCWYERGIGFDPCFIKDNFVVPCDGSAFFWHDAKVPFNTKQVNGVDPLLFEELRNINGYLTEVHHQAYAFMRTVAHMLTKGAVFVVDYGFPAREYYHPDRFLGTVMCHFRHRAHTNPLVLIGQQDITAHVNFTAVASAVRDIASWLGYMPQGRFLIEAGLANLLKNLDFFSPEYKILAGHVNRLISEAEMGELFKIFAFGKEVMQPDVFVNCNRIASLS